MLCLYTNVCPTLDDCIKFTGHILRFHPVFITSHPKNKHFKGHILWLLSHPQTAISQGQVINALELAPVMCRSLLILSSWNLLCTVSEFGSSSPCKMLLICTHTEKARLLYLCTRTRPFLVHYQRSVCASDVHISEPLKLEIALSSSI